MEKTASGADKCICQEPADTGAVAFTEKCGHVFHRGCMSSYVASDTSPTIRCPTCRAERSRDGFRTQLATMPVSDVGGAGSRDMAEQVVFEARFSRFVRDLTLCRDCDTMFISTFGRRATDECLMTICVECRGTLTEAALSAQNDKIIAKMMAVFSAHPTQRMTTAQIERRAQQQAQSDFQGIVLSFSVPEEAAGGPEELPVARPEEPAIGDMALRSMREALAVRYRAQNSMSRSRDTRGAAETNREMERTGMQPDLFRARMRMAQLPPTARQARMAAQRRRGHPYRDAWDLYHASGGDQPYHIEDIVNGMEDSAEFQDSLQTARSEGRNSFTPQEMAQHLAQASGMINPVLGRVMGNMAGRMRESAGKGRGRGKGRGKGRGRARR